MSDPYERALSALELLFSPDLEAVALGAWQEARDAIREAQAQHTALTEQMRASRGAPALKADAEPDEEGTALLKSLDLLPDEPLPIRTE